MKTYYGYYNHCGPCEVEVDGMPLDPRHDLRNHSPDGFQWGYGGSGPAQLALAILADHLENTGLAEVLYQDFKWTVIAKLPKGDFVLHAETIQEAIDQIMVQRHVNQHR